jgi:hypothetical protein
MDIDQLVKKVLAKTAAMGAMEQPAMGTGRGLKKRRITKTAGPRWDAVKRFFASLGDLGNQAAIRAMHRDSMRVMTPEQLQALGPAPSADEMIRRIAAANNKITKTAQDDIQETLSEMLSQAQYHADNQQPFWADQGSTDQSNVSDTFYGHGRGLTRRQAAAIKKTASLLLGRRY